MFKDSTNQEVLGTCDVCHKQKMVSYCPLCKAWLCDQCQRDWAGRGLAALKRFLDYGRAI
jgi:ribosomal protein L37AE/L43A